MRSDDLRWCPCRQSAVQSAQCPQSPRQCGYIASNAFWEPTLARIWRCRDPVCERKRPAYCPRAVSYRLNQLILSPLSFSLALCTAMVLSKRQNQGCGTLDQAFPDMGIRIGAIFIIAAASILGAMVPLIISRYKKTVPTPDSTLCVIGLMCSGLCRP